jgi:hypothetical protein
MNAQVIKKMLRLSWSLSRLVLVAGGLLFAVPSWCSSIFPDTVTGLHCAGSVSSNYACHSSGGLYFGTNQVLLRPLVGFRENNFKGAITSSSFSGSTFTGTFAGDEYLYHPCGRWTCDQIYFVTGIFAGNWNGKWNSPGAVSLTLTSSTLIAAGTIPEPGTLALGLTGLVGICFVFVRLNGAARLRRKLR